MFAMTTHMFSSFSSVLQVFWMYVTSVSSECCKSRSGVAHVAMHVRSRGGARSGGAGPTWAREMQAQVGRAGPSARNESLARAFVRTSGC